MYNLTVRQEKKLREAIPNIDEIIGNRNLFDVMEVLNDQIIDALDENQDMTDESIAWERIYDTVMDYLDDEGWFDNE